VLQHPPNTLPTSQHRLFTRLITHQSSFSLFFFLPSFSSLLSRLFSLLSNFYSHLSPLSSILTPLISLLSHLLSFFLFTLSSVLLILSSSQLSSLAVNRSAQYPASTPAAISHRYYSLYDIYVLTPLYGTHMHLTHSLSMPCVLNPLYEISI
jgi:hypothetical protein